MKNVVWMGLVGLLAAGSVFAQSSELRVKVPFEFVAGDKALPAGEYRVSVDPAFHRISLVQADGNAAVALSSHITYRGTPTVDRGKLVFSQYGTISFLSGVWNAGQSHGYELVKTRHEREMAKKAQKVELAVVR